MENDNTRSLGTNPDPITGAPGAHPVGVGLGAAAGTLAAGPVGTVVGAAVGAVAGGLGGKAVAEHFDPTMQGTAPAEHDLRTTTLPLLE